MDQLSQGLYKQGNKVKVITISTPKHPFLSDQLDQEYMERFEPEHTFVNTLATGKGAILSLASKDAYHLKRFYHPDFEALIRKTLNDFKPDVVILESLFVAPYYRIIRKHAQAKLVYRAHNIEYKLWKQRIKQEKQLLRRAVLKNMVTKLKHAEIDFIQRVDATLAITSNDAKRIKKLTTNPIKIIPFGITPGHVNAATHDTRPKKVLFLGALDWQPNIVGLTWFIENCWAKIHQNYPNWEFDLAGRNATSYFKELSVAGINYLGEIENTSKFYHAGAIFIIPLFTGGGMRIKAIESIAHGTPIVSTKKGMEGIAVKKNKSFLQANDAKSFIKQVSRLIADEELRNRIAHHSLHEVTQHHHTEVLMHRLNQFLHELS